MTDYEYAERQTKILSALPSRMRDAVLEMALVRAWDPDKQVAPKGKVLKVLKELVTPFARIVKEHEAAIAANQAKRAAKKRKWQIVHPNSNTPASKAYDFRADVIAHAISETGHTWKELYRIGYRAVKF